MTGANELIMYVLVTALLAFVVGWLVFVLGARLFRRGAGAMPPGSTLGWALLAVAITGLPALVSFVVNGPLIGWTLPEFWTLLRSASWPRSRSCSSPCSAFCLPASPRWLPGCAARLRGP